MNFENVTVLAEGNVYFEGKVVSHTIHLADGSRKTLGVILPGSYHFGTESPEQMEIIAGACSVALDGVEGHKEVPAGFSFEVPRLSGFTITVEDAPCHYVCSFLD